MRRKIKGLFLAICMLLTLTAITACGAKKEEAVSTGDLTQEELTQYKETASQMIEQISGFGEEEIDYYIAMKDPVTTSVMEGWRSAKQDLGAYKSIAEQNVEKSENEIIITSKTVYEKATANVSLVLDTTQGKMLSMDFEIQHSMSVLMGQAALNTVIGLGTVFLILIFLTFLISLFKGFSKLEERFVGKEKESEFPPSNVEVLEDSFEEELSDDSELVAVITAAIAASERGTAEGFVVRSIKKSNRTLRRV